jgi:glucose/arabinose dehydrogenase
VVAAPRESGPFELEVAEVFYQNHGRNRMKPGFLTRGGAVLATAAAVLVIVSAAEQRPGQPGTATSVQRSEEPAKKYPYPAVRDQTGAVPAGPKVEPYNDPPLGDGPWAVETYEQRHIKVSIVTRGLNAPWGIAFLPPSTALGAGDKVILITEKAGRLRVVRNGVLEPTPVAGIPSVYSQGTMAGLMDIALHPQFATNHWVYISYHKPMGRGVGPDNREGVIASNSVMRGTWDGKGLTDIKDIFVADDVDMEVSRMAFGADGMLFMSIGGPGTGGAGSVIRPQHGNDYAGKILRMRDDGSVPPDNPFIGKADYKPRIFSMGHRNESGMALNPWTKDLWEGEQGPNGGDEINIIRAGRNYGWPLVSDGRDYNGPFISPSPYKEGMERPHVVFVPSIAISSIAFYSGDKFPNWQKNLFVSGMREGEIARTGHLVRLVFNDNWQEMRRESLLRELHQRIRDVRQGPDGFLYVITDEGANSVLLRIEPAS